MHLDGRALLGEPPSHQRANGGRRRANGAGWNMLITWVGEPELLCVENVEGWKYAALTPNSGGDAGGSNRGHWPSLGQGGH